MVVCSYISFEMARVGHRKHWKRNGCSTTDPPIMVHGLQWSVLTCCEVRLKQELVHHDSISRSLVRETNTWPPTILLKFFPCFQFFEELYSLNGRWKDFSFEFLPASLQKMNPILDEYFFQMICNDQLVCDTVDGTNHATVDRRFSPSFTRFSSSQVVQDFFHPEFAGFFFKF